MKKYFIIFAAALCAAVSCKKAEEPTLSVNANLFSVSAAGGKATLEITTNQSWTLASNGTQDWISADKTSGTGNATVVFTVAENKTLEEREIDYLLSAGSLSETITVSQEAAVSNIKFGAPELSKNPVVGQDNSLEINVPYTNALGGEKAEFVITPVTETTEFSATTVAVKDIKAGDGKIALTMNCKPATLGFVEVKLTVGNEVLGNLNVGVFEAPTHTKYIAWNFWAIGYSRADFCYVRGSKYDLSWTSEAINATTSGNTLDHKVLASTCTIAGNEEAYFSAYSSISIVAGGKTIAPNKDPQDLAGYTFNPGIQIKGMVKDDYFFVYLPKVSVAAGGKFSVEGSVGGAKAAANFYIAEYSTDNKNWVEFDNAKTDCVVSDVTYPYHFGYLTTYATRNTYSRDVTVDPAYAVATATAKSAINGPLYIRLRSTGITGGKALITAGGWGDVKFLEVIFD